MISPIYKFDTITISPLRLKLNEKKVEKVKKPIDLPPDYVVYKYTQDGLLEVIFYIGKKINVFT